MAPRILVADDEPNIRDVICFALDRAGMKTTTARNGTEAMMAFHKGGLDLIVLDVGMPDMDGLEVCRRIRKASNLPILFLSARDEEIDRILGLEIGGEVPANLYVAVAQVLTYIYQLKNARRYGAVMPQRPSIDSGLDSQD